ncbi:potassium-transporting ATPase subunit KdpA [Martelella sp. HB161492]|uniref:potassium-transporting ATPase subunit KdpA n=1 Tax=Martelella sp. HB161492 TaxID=2720726 RepID=UPI001591A4B7|nr:potassium-transporting ATPase subunit KdpA [Martelella sp. HB161492]
MGDLVGFALFAVVLTVAAWALAAHMAKVFSGENNALSFVLVPLENRIYRLCGVDRESSQGWRSYALSVLAVNLTGFLALYAILRFQHLLPLNPDGIGAMAPALAFNTAVSFVTNTNWQAYSGEVQLSYLSQMAGMTVENFLSAATGMAIGVAVIRGFAGGTGRGLGNVFVDMTRSILYILLPLSIVLGLFLVLQGVPQTLLGAVHVHTLEGAEQVIARGPAASQIAIKQLGTNGGGFFGVNSAHPFENPNVTSDLAQTFAILLIPAAFTFLFGRMVGDRRQGIALFVVMGILLVTGLLIIHFSELAGNPLLGAGANLEGKEMRFGAALSALWAEATTAASNGSVNAMHDSFMPLSGLVMLINMQIGEVIFGGVGAGLYGMLLYVVLTVFLAGLMVGRTPEYLGRKIEAKEVTLAIIAFLSMPLGILIGGAVSAVVPAALASVQAPGPHGLSEILYAYSSAVGNNGSAFAGFGAATTWQTTALGILMLVGRYAIIVPMLAIAGSLAVKRSIPTSAASFPTHGPLFILLLICTILILGALTFFPVLSLGPIAEQVSVTLGQTF